MLMAAIALASALLGMNRIVVLLHWPCSHRVSIIIALAALLTNWDNLSTPMPHRRSGRLCRARRWRFEQLVDYWRRDVCGLQHPRRRTVHLQDGHRGASQKEAILGGLFGGVLLGLCASA
ncbi:MAG: hypothetical protein ACLT98_03125 [Eggerthellaceae bacterium]